MCGIAGIIHYRNSRCVKPQELDSMCAAIAHRGPDGSGRWISEDRRVGLAHRRLAILDFSPAAGQPMSNEDGTVWITFNGEIYNHVLLRKQLIDKGHSFRSHHSDTEVIVHGYEQWGIDGLTARLSGDYAIGIWDCRNQVLTLVRDRVGVKPLYFSLQQGTLVFASEIKGILMHPCVDRDVDANAMYHYLTFLTTPAPMTMFSKIFKLPAGFYVQVRVDGDFSAFRYWDATPGSGIPESETKGLSDAALEKFYIDGIRSRLTQAVQERTMSDVPLGVFLSGGIDSSTIVSLMSRETGRGIETFTVGFSDHTHLNEFEYARIIAREFGTNHHELMVDEFDMVEYVGRLVHSQDEPIADWTCMPMYFSSKLAKENGVSVIQVGEGSDEQFSGYRSYMAYVKQYHKWWRLFRDTVPTLAKRAIAGGVRMLANQHKGLGTCADLLDRAARDREHFWSGAVSFWDWMKDQLVQADTIPQGNICEELVRTGMLPASYLQLDSFNIVRSFVQTFDRSRSGGDVLTRMIYNEFKLRLPELLLMRVDKISMSIALEARVPFMAHELVEFTMDIPMSFKIRNHTVKYLLKKAVEGLIPNEIINRKKMGFDAPMNHWLRGDFGKEVRRRLLSSSLLDREYFNRDYLIELFDDHASGRFDNSSCIWTVFNMTSWYDYWIEGRTVSTALEHCE
jgi:asparagine synthase (glutamine-hydrolysing)